MATMYEMNTAQCQRIKIKIFGETQENKRKYKNFYALTLGLSYATIATTNKGKVYISIGKEFRLKYFLKWIFW